MISSFRLVRFAIVLTLWLTLLLAAPRLWAAVSLSYFEAEADASIGAIRLSWGTETEVNVAAFRLMRNTTPILATAAQVNQQVAQGANIGGATYTFVDQGVYRATTYYYWLYELTNDGQLTLQRTSQMPQNYLSVTAPDSAPTAPAPTATTVAASTSTPTATQTPVPTTPQTPVVQPVNPQPPTSTPTLDAPGAVAVDTPAATQTPIPASTSAAPATGGPVAGTTEGTQPTPTLPLPATLRPLTATLPPATATSTSPEPLASVELPADLPTSAPSDTPPPPAEPSPTTQAVAQATAAATSAPTGALQGRPTATPRPATTSDAPENTSDLLLVVGGGVICGAALLVVAALVVWRRR